MQASCFQLFHWLRPTNTIIKFSSWMNDVCRWINSTSGLPRIGFTPHTHCVGNATPYRVCIVSCHIVRCWHLTTICSRRHYETDHVILLLAIDCWCILTTLIFLMLLLDCPIAMVRTVTAAETTTACWTINATDDCVRRTSMVRYVTVRYWSCLLWYSFMQEVLGRALL